MILGGGGVKSTAQELLLHLLLEVGRCQRPPLLGKLALLFRVNGQAGARDRELDQEQHKQNDHVLWGWK